MYDDSRQDDTAFFPYLATNSIFDAFGRFDKPSQRREPVWRPTLLPSQKQSFTIVADDGDNDRWVGPRKGKVGQRGSS